MFCPCWQFEGRNNFIFFKFNTYSFIRSIYYNKPAYFFNYFFRNLINWSRKGNFNRYNWWLTMLKNQRQQMCNTLWINTNDNMIISLFMNYVWILHYISTDTASDNGWSYGRLYREWTNETSPSTICLPTPYITLTVSHLCTTHCGTYIQTTQRQDTYCTTGLVTSYLFGICWICIQVSLYTCTRMNDICFNITSE